MLISSLFVFLFHPLLNMWCLQCKKEVLKYLKAVKLEFLVFGCIAGLIAYRIILKVKINRFIVIGLKAIKWEILSLSLYR